MERLRIWAIGDLHLSFGVPGKSMAIFGPQWENHADQIASHWRRLIAPSDLVLIPGDISWAMRPEEARVDLEWIDLLPGTKVLLKGNHDYWWGSLSKLAPLLPPSIHLVQNNAFHWKGVAIGGSRLWDTPEYSFGSVIPSAPSSKDPEELVQQEMQEKIFNRELERLKMSLKAMDPKAPLKIAMTHYPPIGLDLKRSRAAQILEEYGVQICVFGHLHGVETGVKAQEPLFGEARGVHYLLTSADYIHFQPLAVASL